MKQKLLMLLALLLALPSLARDFTYQGITYTVLDEDAKTCQTKAGGRASYSESVKPGNNLRGAITIPAVAIYGDTEYSVTALGEYAFYKCTGLTSVVLPESLTAIGDGAFYECTGLTSAVLPESLNTLGNSAFSNCYKLTSVELPETITTIGRYTFSGCTGLTSIVLPESLTTIGNYAFDNCTGLTSVECGNSLTTIGNYAFNNCTGLTSVVLPESLTTIGDCAFYVCTGLTSVVLPESLTTIGDRAFYDCTRLTSVELPKSLTSIGSAAFAGCISLTSVVLGDSLTSIGNSAFSRCRKLSSIEFPETLTTIDNYAFSGCESLNFVELPEALKYLGREAFEGCKSIVYVVIRSTDVEFGSDVFPATNFYIIGGENVSSISNTANVITVENPNDIVMIDNVLFNSDMSRLIRFFSKATEYKIPSSVMEYESDAFTNSSLQVIDMGDTQISSIPKGSLPERITSIVFPNLMQEIEAEIFNGFKDLTDVVCPNSLKKIGDRAFSGCSGLKSLDLPEGLREIGAEAFRGCSGLKSLVLPEGLQVIGRYAFSGCSLTNVVFPNTLELIGSYAFQMASLKSVEIYSPSLKIEDDAFYKCKALESVKLDIAELGSNVFGYGSGSTPIEHKFAYINATLTGNIGYFKSILLGPDAKPVNVYAANGISNYLYCDYAYPEGNGFNNIKLAYIKLAYSKEDIIAENKEVVYNHDKTELLYVQPYFRGELFIPATVNRLRYDVLGHTTFKLLNVEDADKELVIEKGIWGFGVDNLYMGRSWRYEGTGSLPKVGNVIFGEKVTSIPTGAFKGLTTLAQVTFTPGTTSAGAGLTIGSEAFNGCTAITELDFPSWLTDINSDAFKGCTALAKVAFSKGLNSIGSGAFDGCSALTELDLPSSLTTIGDNAFASCKVTSLTFPGAIKEIGENAFADCPITAIRSEAVSAPAVAANSFANVPSTIGVAVPDDGFGSYMSPFNNWTYFDCLRSYSAGMNPVGASHYGNFAFRRIGETETAEIVRSDAYSDLTAAEIPETVTLVVKEADEEAGTPEETVDLTVVSIAPNSFSGFETIETVIFPATVTKIGNMAFRGCSALKSVAFGEGLSEIGMAAFQDCSSLAAIELPESVKDIRSNAFQNCASLATISLNSGLRTIGDGAFGDCVKLKSVNIGDEIELIDDYAFKGCSALATITIGRGNDAVIGREAFMTGSSRLATNVVLGEGVVEIGDNAFANIQMLRKVEVPEGSRLRRIGNGAFTGATALTAFNLPQTVTEIGTDAFNGCRALSALAIPENPELAIGDNAFNACTRLTALGNETRIKSIGKRSFASCTALKQVNVKAGSIGAEAFMGCNNLTETTVEADYLGTRAFQQCAKLTKVDANVNVVDSLAFGDCQSLSTVSISGRGNIGYQAFSMSDTNLRNRIDSLFVNVPTIGERSFYNDSIGKIVFGDTVRAIGKEAFYNGTIRGALRFNDDIERIGNSAFRECELDSVIFPMLAEPNPVIVIEPHAFYTYAAYRNNGRYGYESTAKLPKYITLGNRVKEVREKAGFCPSVRTGLDLGSSVQVIYDGGLMLPSNWRSNGLAIYSNGDGMISVKLPGSLKRIGGTIHAYELEIEFAPEQLFADKLHAWNRIYIDRSNTGSIIGKEDSTGSPGPDNLVYGEHKEAAIDMTTSLWFKNIHIGGAVKKISSQECGFENLTFSEGVEEIADNALVYSNRYGTPKTADLKLPGSLKYIGQNAINCQGIWKPFVVENIHFASGGGELTLSANSFGDITELKKTVKTAFIGRNLATDPKTSREPFTLEGSAVLDMVVVGDSVTRINDNMFKDCTALKNAVLTDSLQTVGNMAFRNCSLLNVLSIPEKVTTIGDEAYVGCTGLERVVARSVVPAEPAENNTGNVFDTETEDNVPLYAPNVALEDYEYAPLFFFFGLNEHLHGHADNVVAEVVTDADFTDVKAGDVIDIVEQFGLPEAIMSTDTVEVSYAKAPRKKLAKGAAKVAAANDLSKQFYWFAPNPDVVSVTRDGVMTVHKNEPAEIWAYVLDGSDKKAVIGVNQTKLGDVNEDGTVDLLDVDAMTEHILAPVGSTVKLKVADMNKDRNIDLIDVDILIENLLTAE